MKLHLNFYGAARLDIEPTGAFFRSFVHDRKGDPHASLHWEPQAGSTKNTWHLTRRKQDRVWLPEFEQARLLDFLERLQLCVCKNWIYGLQLIDLDGAERGGWRFCVSFPSELAQRTVRELGSNEAELNVGVETVLTVVQHSLIASEAPTGLRDRGPEGPTPITPAYRWHNGELLDTASVVWMEHGVWDPFVDGEPVFVGPPGWYWMPREILSRELFLWLLGPDAEEGLRVARQMVQDFFGPPVRDTGEERRECERRIADLLEQHRRSRCCP